MDVFYVINMRPVLSVILFIVCKMMFVFTIPIHHKIKKTHNLSIIITIKLIMDNKFTTIDDHFHHIQSLIMLEVIIA